MKRILILCFLFPLVGITQQKKSPTSPGSAQIEKELKELEKTDPEMAKKVRQMMQQSKQTPGSKPAVAEKPFRSPYITLKLPQSLPKASPTAKDRILWYVGKKINDTTLVTQSGTIVQFQKKQNRVVVQSDPKGQGHLKKLATNLSLYEKSKGKKLEYFNSSQSGFFYFPAIVDAITEMDHVYNEYLKMATNYLDLTTEKYVPAQAQHSSGGTQSSKRILIMADSILDAYNEVKEMIKDHPSLDFDTPPQVMKTACFTCDNKKLSEHKQAIAVWSKHFNEFEARLFGKATLVLKRLEFSISPQDEALRNQITQEMMAAQQMAIGRWKNKLNILENEYGKNFDYIPLLIQQTASYYRMLELLDDQRETKSLFQKISEYLKSFDQYLYKQFLESNHRLVLNMPQIMAVYTEQELLSGESKHAWYLDNLINNYNRFKFNMTVDVNVTSENIKAGAAIDSKPDFYVAMGIDSCRYFMTVAGVDYRTAEESEVYVPFNARSGSRKSQKEEDDKWVNYSYSGPQDLMSVFPAIKIDFCDEGAPDTCRLSIFRFKKEITSADIGKFPQAYSIDFPGYLNLLLMNTEAGEESAPEMSIIGNQMMAIHAANYSQTGDANYDGLREAYTKFIEQDRLQKQLFELMITNKTQLLFQANDVGTTLIRAEDNFQLSHGEWSVDKGVVRLLVTHSPLTINPPTEE